METEMGIKELEIIECFDNRIDAVTRGVIHEQTGIPQTTLTRLLPKLVKLGYLQKIAHGKYATGERLSKLTGQGPREATPRPQSQLVFLSHASNAVDRLYAGINGVLRDENMRCMMHAVPNGLKNLTETDLRFLKDAPGLFIFSVSPLPEILTDWLQKTGKPAVVIGYSGYACCDTVNWDQYTGFKWLAEAMLDRGFKRVVMLVYGFPYRASVEFRRRKKGYDQAMRDLGLEPHSYVVEPGFLHSDEACPVLQKLVGKDSKAEDLAFVLADNDAGMRLFLEQRLEEIGIRVKDGVRFAGLLNRGGPNPNVPAHLQYCLGIEEPWQLVGQVAAMRFIGRLDGDKSPPRLIHVRPEIETRF